MALASTRRQFIQAIAGEVSLLALLGCTRRDEQTEQGMVTLYTFGDSILDCARYNDYGVHPGQLLVRNDDHLFPKFRGPRFALPWTRPTRTPRPRRSHSQSITSSRARTTSRNTSFGLDHDWRQ